MSVIFKTHLSNISLTTTPTEKYQVRFNFDGFKKLVCNNFSSKETKTNNSDEFLFDYTTIYPHDLNLKWLTIKCYKKNLLTRTLVATSRINLLFLATGPSKHVQELSTNQGEKLTLSFTCSFVQFCQGFSFSLKDQQQKSLKFKMFNGKNNLEFDESITLSETVDNLEQYALVIEEAKEIIYSFPIMKDYNTNLIDLPRTILLDRGTLLTLVISRGPLYHQMSSDSFSKNGVLTGKIFPGYPLPSILSPNSIIGFTNVGEKNIATWPTMEKLIHQHFSKLLMKETEENKDISEKIIKLKNDLNNTIIRAKIRYKIDIS
jgi:hypothetical protein